METCCFLYFIELVRIIRLNVKIDGISATPDFFISSQRDINISIERSAEA